MKRSRKPRGSEVSGALPLVAIFGCFSSCCSWRNGPGMSLRSHEHGKLYSIKNADAIRRLFGVDPGHDLTGNLPSMSGIFPDYPAPIVRNSGDGRELLLARWPCRHRRRR